MPSEVSFPNQEKYELKKGVLRKTLSAMRVGLWKDVGNYEELRFSSGRACYQEVGISPIWLLISKNSVKQTE